MDEPRVTCADRLRMARKAAGLDQKTLAAKLGVAHSTISAAERGKSELGASKFIRWGAETGVSLDWLATGEQRNGRKN